MIGKILVIIADNWVFINSFFIDILYSIEIKVQGGEKLKKKDWYMVISNHQTWVDIVILQKIFHGKIPVLKFFLKKELIWVPILGLAWWALDFPFMKRYTKEQITANPKLKGKDIEITRKACEKFRTDPIAIMTFPEGTRFTGEKHEKQKSPYKHLLKPKAGGLSFTISSMGDQIHRLINVTIVYPEGIKPIWDFMCGRVGKINVFIESILIPEKFIGMNPEDKLHQNEFNTWLNALWHTKDALIDSDLKGKKNR